jgi:salicylate hydroxylase
MASKSASNNTADVVIVGGGIGGLTLAVALRRLNISYIVLERNESMPAKGAGLTIAPNSLRMLQQIGLFESIAAGGQPWLKQLVYRNSTHWRTLDMSVLQRDFGYHMYTIERHTFHQDIFREAGGEEKVRFGAKVIDVIDDPNNESVRVLLENGSEVTAKMVVGADGVRSIVRRLLAAKAGLQAINTTRFTGRRHLLGYTHRMPYYGPEHSGVGTWLFYDDGIFTSWPCKDHHMTFTGIEVSLSYRNEYLSRQRLLTLFRMLIRMMVRNITTFGLKAYQIHFTRC